MDRTTLKIENYKSFSSPGAQIDGFKPFNLIVGKNNSGKSALIDSIEIVTGKRGINERNRKAADGSRIIIGRFLDLSDLQSVFKNDQNMPLWSWIGEPLQDQYVEYVSHAVGGVEGELVLPEALSSVRNIVANHGLEGRMNALKSAMKNIFKGREFFKLSAERDVTAEGKSLEILPNGRGLTGVLAKFLHQNGYPRDLVRHTLLNRLNEILYPDTQFSEIVVQQNEQDNWEIYLLNSEGNLIPLADSGSGIKTVFLIASYIEIIPSLRDAPLSKFIFAFEEPENNLHPAVQRRLVSYVLRRCREDGFIAFMTTHSSSIIDSISGEEDCQILHVSHNGKESSVRRVNAYRDAHSIIEDLGVRASDLLQSNCLVWLEGPSDRVYFNRWIDLYSGGLIREGMHYQCLYYGGKILSHFSFSDEEDESKDLIDALNINKNAIILMDSDKSSAFEEINSTKKRVLEEVTSFGGHCWITYGREIENYIPDASLSKKFEVENMRLSTFVDIKEYLNRKESGLGKRFERTKVLFAKEIAPLISLEDIEPKYDWLYNISKCHSLICKWNGLDEHSMIAQIRS